MTGLALHPRLQEVSKDDCHDSGLLVPKSTDDYPVLSCPVLREVVKKLNLPQKLCWLIVKKSFLE